MSHLKRYFLSFILLSTALYAQSIYAQTSISIEAQRAAFKEAIALAQKGDEKSLKHKKDVLNGYLLKPDIVAAYLTKTIDQQPNRVINKFLKGFPDHASSNKLLRTWLDHLHATKQWQAYLNHFPTTNLADTSVGRQCEHIHARLQSGTTIDFNKEVLPLWMVGKSQVTECDSVFKEMQKNGFITEERVEKRIHLALQKAKFSLATFLSKALPTNDQEAIRQHIKQWKKMSQAPEQHLQQALNWVDTSKNQAIVAYGIKKQARLDISKALPLWAQLSKRYGFSMDTKNEVNNYLALRAAYQRHSGTAQQYTKTQAHTLSLRENEWRIRNALWFQDWSRVLNAIRLLPSASQASPQWTYWKARAYESLGRIEEAQKIYQSIVQEKGYFSFLSADRLNAQYTLPNSATIANNTLLSALEQRVDLRRARELHSVNKLGYSRSEWRNALDKLTRDEKAQAALLAARWGLPTNSIRSAILSGARSDLSLMYPIAFTAYVKKYAQQKNLEPAWVMGLMRQESLFMQDVKSSANAYGLMQLLPATAKETARRNKFKYAGYSHLISPQHNIRLGTAYLAQVQNSLQTHPILATAAYNGGPHRVKTWLPKQIMPADIWVENIVFNETRKYVQKVMENKVIYSELMYKKPLRLSNILVDIKPRS